MPRTLHESELRNADLVWLVDLTYAGRVWRFSTESLVVDYSETGESLQYEGVVKPFVVRQGFDLLDDSPSGVSVSFDISWPSDLVTLQAQGHRFRSARVDVSLHIVGNDYADRMRVVRDAACTGAQWGPDGEPVRFEARSVPYDDSAEIPAPAAQLDERARYRHRKRIWSNLRERPPVWTALTKQSYTNVHTSDEGKVAPLVFGAPGLYIDEEGTEREAYCTPAYVIGYTTSSGTDYATDLLIAGHAVRADKVKVYNKKLGAAYDDLGAGDFDVSTTTDTLGNTYSYIDLTNQNGATPVANASRLADDEYWICWHSGGGLPNETQDGELTGAGEVLKYMLDRSSLPVDEGRCRAAYDYLNQIKVAGYVNEFVSPWEWLQDNLLPIVTASLAVSGEGVYPVPWALDAVSANAHADISEGADFTRVSLIEETEDELVNDLRLKWAQEYDDKYSQTAYVTGRRITSDDTQSVDVYATVSRIRYGEHSKTVESDILYDRSSAYLAAHRMVRAMGFPRLILDYMASTDWAWLEPGMIVKMTDSALQWTDRVGVVFARALSTEQVGFSIAFVEDPARDVKASG